MIIHYNIKKDSKEYYGSRNLAIFYFAECEPSFMFAITNWVRNMFLDKSVGTVFYNDWDWMADQGTMRIESACGCAIETLAETCNKIVAFAHEIENEEFCKYCKCK